jgi:SAM-dependent methyltransferase
MSLRYIIGYSLLLFPRLVSRVLNPIWRLISLPEQFAVIVWTPKEIDQYSRFSYWNDMDRVLEYPNFVRRDDWVGNPEKRLFQKYLSSSGELLNLACGAGRETMMLAKKGLTVTGYDWSPEMIAAAQRRAQEEGLPIRFEVADLYDLHFPDNAFDYLLLTNIAYSYLIPRSRRMRFLRQAFSVLRPRGLFIISFAGAVDGPSRRRGFFEPLFKRLSRYAPFNPDYEPGDKIRGSFFHVFQPEELRQEFEEAKFLIKEWLWKQGCAVLTKG